MKTFTLFSLLLPVLPVLAADKLIFLDNWGSINSALNSKIVPVPVTKRNPWVESIPEACVYEAQKHFSDSVAVPRCKVDDMRVVEVSFGDAPGTTWITCRCKDTVFTEAQFFAQLGRVPVAARQVSWGSSNSREG